MAGISDNFIAEVKEELEFRQKEKEQLLDQLALYDVRLDRYDAIIENMDKSLLPLIDEINVASQAVEDAYEARIAAGCKSELVWALTGTVEYKLPFKFGPGAIITMLIYSVIKNPAVYEKYNRWGIKYYRRPKNQDYGSNIITEFFGSISLGNTNLAIKQIGLAGTSGVMLGDIITDDLENPEIFGIDDLPQIVGFGVSNLVIDTKMFGGEISIGSTIIAQVGVGTTGEINVGNSIIGTSVLPPNTLVVGIGTTTISENLWDFDLGTFISTDITAPALIVSQPALATTSIEFAVGITSNYPSFFLSTVADGSTDLTNFTIIRQTQTVLDEFDPSNNPNDPVTVGIMNNSSVGLGHTAIRVNNGAPVGPFQWREVLGNYDPEPSCGNGFDDWYTGTLQWPTLITYTYDTEGDLVSVATTYAPEGTQVKISVGSTLPPPVGTGYTNTSENNPTFSGCGALDAAISAAEATRDEIIAKNQPIIDSTLAAASGLRKLRDKLESSAFIFLQGRAAADAEIVRLNKALENLESLDLSKFEPTTNITKNKFSSNTVGIATTS
jgi:hypothetical protein